MKRVQPADHSRQQGFTLIELSIVLVIIGLIIGAVLTGQDLIRTAQIRATISQLEKYNASVNTFHGKYGAAPGDISVATATSYANLFVFTGPGAGAQGHGDGNGLIEDGAASPAGGANGNRFGGEIAAFWRHLSDASLIDGSFGKAGNSLLLTTDALPTAAVTTVSQSIPPAKLGFGMSFTVMSYGGYNYYAMLPITAISAAGAYTIAGTGISPIVANTIDIKIDDGVANTGTVQSIGLGVPTAAGGAAASTGPVATAARCNNTAVTNPAVYNLSQTTGGNDPSCALAIRFN